MNCMYVTTACSACKPIIAGMQRTGLTEVAIKNIDLNPAWGQELARHGSQSVPTAVIHGRVYVGASDIRLALYRTYGVQL